MLWLTPDYFTWLTSDDFTRQRKSSRRERVSEHSCIIYISKCPIHVFISVKVLEEFYNIFGPELKAVTGDPKRIEDVVKRVDGLVKPLENVSNWFVVRDIIAHRIALSRTITQSNLTIF